MTFLWTFFCKLGKLFLFIFDILSYSALIALIYVSPSSISYANQLN